MVGVGGVKMLLNLLKIAINKKYFSCVGRGVLRFWHARYRKPRSNLGSFSKIGGISVSGGVDIIYAGCGVLWVFGFYFGYSDLMFRLFVCYCYVINAYS